MENLSKASPNTLLDVSGVLIWTMSNVQPLFQGVFSKYRTLTNQNQYLHIVLNAIIKRNDTVAMTATKNDVCIGLLHKNYVSVKDETLVEGWKFGGRILLEG